MITFVKSPIFVPVVEILTDNSSGSNVEFALTQNLNRFGVASKASCGVIKKSLLELFPSESIAADLVPLCGLAVEIAQVVASAFPSITLKQASVVEAASKVSVQGKEATASQVVVKEPFVDHSL